MNIFSKLASLTLTSKVYNFIKSGYYYLKDYQLIKDTLYSEQFKFVLKKYINIDIKTDWIGRLYGVINPNIDINGRFDASTMIIEIDGDNTNNNDQVKNWFYKQIHLIGDLFKINKLYDYISVDFEHVGPENMDNYLIIIDMVSRKEFAFSFKKMFKQLFVYAFIGLIVLCIMHFI